MAQSRLELPFRITNFIGRNGTQNPHKSEKNIETIHFFVFRPHLHPRRFPENFGRLELSEVRFPLGLNYRDARGPLTKK